MPALAILNPRSKGRTRRARSGGRKRRRSMTAKQLKFFGPRKKRKAATRRKKARAKPAVIIVKSNPKGTSMAKKRRHSRRRKAAKPFTHRRVKRYRRNPRSLEAGFFKNTLAPAAIGAGGAIASDYLLSMAPIPQQYKTGYVGLALKIGASLLVGAAVGAVSNREAGEEAAAGGVIVTLYQMSRGFLAGNTAAAPAAMSRFAMSGYAPGPMNRGQGAFAPRMPGLGYTSPARQGIRPPVMPRGLMRYAHS